MRSVLLTIMTVGAAAILPSPAIAGTALRVATLAPKSSTWGKVYSAWAKALEAKTGGALTVQMLNNGTSGMSSGVISRIESGQLDGGSLGLADLAVYYRDVFAIELPGTMKAWSEIDPVRAAFQTDIAAALDAEGVRFGWWEDWGRVRLFTRGYAAPRPVNLVGKQLAAWTSAGIGDPVMAELLTTAGASISVAPTSFQGPAAPGGFFGPAMLAAPLAADHVGDDVLWCGTHGAMVFGKRTLSSLPPDVLHTFEGMSAAVSQALAARVRGEDDASYARFAQTTTVVTQLPSQSWEWDLVFSQVATRLAKGKLDKSAVNRVLTMRGLPAVP